MEPMPSTLSPSLTTSVRNHPLPPSRLPGSCHSHSEALCPGFSSARPMPGRQAATGGVQPERQWPSCSLSSDSSWLESDAGAGRWEPGVGQHGAIHHRGRRFSPEPSPHTHVHTYL